ncbi:MAG TPA: hypothetical protein VHP83_21195 [Aggregatilineaceae bacterium]|nr:hypothetical protein [Aggregatilineaceae bacterium]
MLNPFKMFNRLAWLMILLFGGGTAAMVGIIVMATGGLGSTELLNIPQFTTPTGATAPEPEVRLNEVVEKRPVFEAVPLPSEISTKPSVVGTNLGLAILLAIIFGIDSTILNNLLRQEEARLRRWFSFPGLRSFFGLLKFGSEQNIRRGCLTLPLVALIFALYGVIFAFLEGGLNIFSPEGIQLAIVMAMSVGLISLAGDVAQRRVAMFWRRTSRFGVYPANTLLAVLTTILSRTIHLSPGIVFGVPGGVDVDMKDEPRFHNVILAFTTLTVMVVLGGLGWLAASAINAAGDRMLTADQAEFAGGLAQLGLSIGLGLFLVAVETAFFEMVPLTATMGSEIFRWNIFSWFAAFVPVTFAFVHTLLNPNSDYLDAFRHTNVQVLTIIVTVLTLVTAFLWLYFRVLRPAPEEPYPGYGAPPHYPSQQPYPPYQQPRSVQQPPQPAVRPAPQVPPPPSPRQQAARPQQRPPAPPPIIISDNVPPPIVLSDRPENWVDDQETQRWDIEGDEDHPTL